MKLELHTIGPEADHASDECVETGFVQNDGSRSPPKKRHAQRIGVELDSESAGCEGVAHELEVFRKQEANVENGP